MDDLVSAVKKLRSAIGDTRQEFANRLDLSISAVVNYEKDRRPSRAVLFQLALLASEHGLHDLSTVFKAAYAETMKGITRPTNDEELAWVRMILTLIRNKDFVPGFDQIGISLLGALEGLVKIAADGTALNTQPEELDEALTWARGQITPDPSRKLHRMASDRSRSTGETYHLARAALLLENPDLYHEYQNYLATLQPLDEKLTEKLPKEARPKGRHRPTKNTAKTARRGKGKK